MQSTPITAQTSVVTLNGTVIAGEYYNLNLTINADGSVTEAAGGEPIVAQYSPNFDTSAFLTNAFKGGSQDFGSLVADGVPAVVLPSLFASGGDVEIDAITLNGSGTVTANGSPDITVTNAQPIYLLIAPLGTPNPNIPTVYIPQIPGGGIDINAPGGKAAAEAEGLTIDEEGGSGNSSISIKLSEPDLANSSVGPALFILGSVQNTGGLVDVEDATGSVGTTGSYFGNVIRVVVPEGAYVVTAAGSEPYMIGEFPGLEWSASEIYPGGNQVNGAPDPNAALNYVAASIFQRGSCYNGSGAISTATAPGAGDINESLYGYAGISAPNNVALKIFGTCYVGPSNCSIGQNSYNYVSNTFNTYNFTLNATNEPPIIFSPSIYLPGYNNETLAATAAASAQNTSGSAQSIQIFGKITTIEAAARVR